MTGKAVLDINESDWTVLDINEEIGQAVLNISESDWASASGYK